MNASCCLSETVCGVSRSEKLEWGMVAGGRVQITARTFGFHNARRSLRVRSTGTDTGIV